MDLKGLKAPRLVTKNEDRSGDLKVKALIKKYGHDYYLAHRDEIMKNWYARAAKNPKLHKKRVRQYAINHARRIALDPERLKVLLWKKAKRRAEQFGLRFNISPDDLNIPETCPVFGFKLESAFGLGIGRGARGIKPNSPSVDRINSNKGYVKGNVAVISHRANTLKRNASLEELVKLVRWLRRVTR